MSIAKTLINVTATMMLVSSTAALAQSAGTSLGGTSNGKPGIPASSYSIGTPAAQGQTGTTGATSAAKPGDTPGNSGALGQGTAEQHEKLGN